MDKMDVWKKVMEDLRTSKEDPWLSHIPLSRVNEMMIQTLSLSWKMLGPAEQEKIIIPMCIAATSCPEISLSILSDIPNESTIWSNLVEKIEEGIKICSKAIILVYENRNCFLQKHVLECLASVSEHCMQKLSYLENNSDKYSVQTLSEAYLGHSCSEYVNTETVKYKYAHLPSVICSNKKYFNDVFSLIKNLLKNSKYSILSIKVAAKFYSILKKEFDNISILGNPEIIGLMTLLSDPPCINCSKLIYSPEDLTIFKDKIDLLLGDMNNVDLNNVKTVLCLNHEWLIELKCYSVVRTLFI